MARGNTKVQEAELISLKAIVWYNHDNVQKVDEDPE